MLLIHYSHLYLTVSIDQIICVIQMDNFAASVFTFFLNGRLNLLVIYLQNRADAKTGLLRNYLRLDIKSAGLQLEPCSIL